MGIQPHTLKNPFAIRDATFLKYDLTKIQWCCIISVAGMEKSLVYGGATPMQTV